MEKLALNGQELFDLSRQASDTHCEHCNSFQCVGWDTKPSGFIDKQYPVVGTLQTEGSENNWAEYHPNKTTMWSVDAPIAVNYYPYNRSDVLRCMQCQKIYLKYSEFGGYYVDQRIRLVQPDLVVVD